MSGTGKMNRVEILLLLLAAVSCLGMTTAYLAKPAGTGGSYEVTTAAWRNAAEQEVEKVNINTATPEELENLPQIGPTLAQRIVDYRKEHGAFAAPEDLLGVEGIGEKRLQEIRECITWEVTE